MFIYNYILLHIIMMNLEEQNNIYYDIINSKKNIKNINYNLLNNDLLQRIINYNYGVLFSQIPLDLRNDELSLQAVKLNGYNLFFVNDIYKTKELCLIAFSNNKLCTKAIPTQFRTLKIYEEYLSEYKENHIENLSDFINPFFIRNFKLNYVKCIL